MDFLGAIPAALAIGNTLFGGGSKSGSSTQTSVAENPYLLPYVYGGTNPATGESYGTGLSGELSRLYNTYAGGMNPYLSGKLYSLADQSGSPFNGSVAPVQNASVYAQTGMNMAPQTQAANTGWNSMFNPFIANSNQQLQQGAVNYLQQSLLPTLNSNAIMAGGYGGDRNALAIGQATGQTAQGLLSAEAQNLLNAFNTEQALGLQNASTNAGYRQQAGLANQAAGLAGMGMGLQARGQDLAQNLNAANFGLNAYQAGQAGAANAANLYQNAANYEFNQPLAMANWYRGQLAGLPSVYQTGQSTQPVYTNPFGNAAAGYLFGQALFGNQGGGSSSSLAPNSVYDQNLFGWQP